MKLLSEIQASFYARSFNIDAVNHLLWSVAGIATLIILYLFFRYIQARKVRYSPFGSIVDGRMIRNILRVAFDQRRPFEVQVQTDTGQRRPTLRCAPEYIGKDTFTVEISGLKSLSDKWIGRAVTVFFRIQLNKEFTYYTFASAIESIHAPRPEVCQISLPIPTALENRQKRSFLRILPPRDFFPGAAIWCADAMPPPEKIHEVSLWNRPKLLYLPGRMEQFQVLDLSAGGARLSVPHASIREFQLQFNSAEQIILMLDLFDPEQNRRLRFWMQCRVQNVWIEHSSRDVHMGLQFQAWARPKEGAAPGEQGGVGLEWLRLSASSEVEPVGNWIMRRHLELFRENPPDL